MTTTLRNIAHDLIAVVGVLLAMQAPITAYLANVGTPGRYVDLGFGGLGLIAAVVSKAIDSHSFTSIQVAASATPAGGGQATGA